MQRDFWSNSEILVIGGGSWGTVLAQLLAQRALRVKILIRDEEQARAMNSVRVNEFYVPELKLHERITVMTDPMRAFSRAEGGLGNHAIVWALPSEAGRDTLRQWTQLIQGNELVFHATKGVESQSMKRMSEMIVEEWPVQRVGVISGPNLALEIARGEPAATVVASRFDEVIEAGIQLFSSPKMRVYPTHDVVGVEWAGALKNILAIAAGAVDQLKLGWNTRSMLITRGLAEMVRFGRVQGAEAETFLGLAGMGDLLATCSSPLSRNFQVGARLAKGEQLSGILEELGKTAEGVRTTRSVWEFAEKRAIDMPITQAVYHLLEGTAPLSRIIESLMARPQSRSTNGV